MNGIGSLQCVASSRDAQVCRKGIGYVVDERHMPERGLKNADGSSLFSLTSSRLGVDFFLGYYGPALAAGGGVRTRGGIAVTQHLEFLCRAKNSSVAKFMQRSDKQHASRCVIQ